MPSEGFLDDSMEEDMAALLHWRSNRGTVQGNEVDDSFVDINEDLLQLRKDRQKEKEMKHEKKDEILPPSNRFNFYDGASYMFDTSMNESNDHDVCPMWALTENACFTLEDDEEFLHLILEREEQQEAKQKQLQEQRQAELQADETKLCRQAAFNETIFLRSVSAGAQDQLVRQIEYQKDVQQQAGCLRPMFRSASTDGPCSSNNDEDRPSPIAASTLGISSNVRNVAKLFESKGGQSQRDVSPPLAAVSDHDFQQSSIVRAHNTIHRRRCVDTNVNQPYIDNLSKSDVTEDDDTSSFFGNMSCLTEENSQLDGRIVNTDSDRSSTKHTLSFSYSCSDGDCGSEAASEDFSSLPSKLYQHSRLPPTNREEEAAGSVEMKMKAKTISLHHSTDEQGAINAESKCRVVADNPQEGDCRQESNSKKSPIKAAASGNARQGKECAFQSRKLEATIVAPGNVELSPNDVSSSPPLISNADVPKRTTRFRFYIAEESDENSEQEEGAESSVCSSRSNRFSFYPQPNLQEEMAKQAAACKFFKDIANTGTPPQKFGGPSKQNARSSPTSIIPSCFQDYKNHPAQLDHADSSLDTMSFSENVILLERMTAPILFDQFNVDECYHNEESNYGSHPASVLTVEEEALVNSRVRMQAHRRRAV